MSSVPRTHEAIERWQQGKINIFDEMAKLETELNFAEAERIDLAKQLRSEKEMHAACQNEREEIAALVRRLFELLETVEVSDSEREFHPTYISSCRVVHTMELDKLLPKLKEAAK